MGRGQPVPEEKAPGPGDLRNLWLFLAWPAARRQVGGCRAPPRSLCHRVPWRLLRTLPAVTALALRRGAVAVRALRHKGSGGDGDTGRAGRDRQMDGQGEALLEQHLQRGGCCKSCRGGLTPEGWKVPGARGHPGVCVCRCRSRHGEDGVLCWLPAR